MIGPLRIPLCILSAGFAYAGASASREIDPRVEQRPAVVKPACNEPKPYYIEHWTPEVVGFRIGLAADRAHGELEAARLASKYKIDVSDSLSSGSVYAIFVAWLDPEQVAGLRCEQLVNSIEFIMPLTLAQVMSNVSLQRGRDR
jgi:hypothetical protein